MRYILVCTPNEWINPCNPCYFYRDGHCVAEDYMASKDIECIDSERELHHYVVKHIIINKNITIL
jgi:hypothetical protein